MADCWTFSSNGDEKIADFGGVLEKDTASKGNFADDFKNFVNQFQIVKCPFITSQSVENVEVCRIANCRIDASNWRCAMLACGTGGSKISEIYLHNVQIGSPSFLVEMSKSLEKSCTVTTLRLQYVIFDGLHENSAAYCDAFKQLFSDSTCLEYISMKGCQFTDTILTQGIALGMANSFKLRAVNFSENNITDEGVTTLLKKIKLNSNFTHITLASNQIAGDCLATLYGILNGTESTAEDDATLKALTKGLADKNKAIKDANKKRKKAGFGDIAECNPPPLADSIIKKDGKNVVVNKSWMFVDLSCNPMSSDSAVVQQFVQNMTSSSWNAASTNNGKTPTIVLAGSKVGGDSSCCQPQDTSACVWVNLVV